MQLYLIRHPQPEIASGICYGQSNIDVSDLNCQLISTQLKNAFPAEIELFSSPLRRCVKLAQLLHHSPNLDTRLMEMHFGKWEMQSWDEIARNEIDAWAADVIGYQPEGGEATVDVAARVIDFLGDLGRKNMNEATIVAHAGSIRMILAYQDKMQAHDLAEEVVRLKKTILFGECIVHQTNYAE